MGISYVILKKMYGADAKSQNQDVGLNCENKQNIFIFKDTPSWLTYAIQ